MSNEFGSPVDRLVRAGARLMAEHSWEAVDLAEVAVEAGVDDSAAVAYHFGSREGLLMEIVSRSIEAMEGRRRRDLQHLSPESDLGELLHALVAPLADLLLEAEHRDFLRLNSQLAIIVEKKENVVGGPVVGTAFGEEWELVRAALTERFGENAARRRIRWLMVMVLVTLGSRAAEVSGWVGDAGSRADIDAAAVAHGELPHDDFVSAVTRMLTAAICIDGVPDVPSAGFPEEPDRSISPRG